MVSPLPWRWHLWFWLGGLVTMGGLYVMGARPDWQWMDVAIFVAWGNSFAAGGFLVAWIVRAWRVRRGRLPIAANPMPRLVVLAQAAMFLLAVIGAGYTRDLRFTELAAVALFVLGIVPCQVRFRRVAPAHTDQH